MKKFSRMKQHDKERANRRKEEKEMQREVTIVAHHSRSPYFC
jgi:hypothetical protein